MALAPVDPTANQTAVAMLLAAGASDEAMAVAQALREREPRRALGHELVGDVERARGAARGAVQSYQTALREEPQTRTAIRLHDALLTQGDASGARGFALSWLRGRPGDTVFLLNAGAAAAAAGDYALAEDYFHRAQKLQPDNPAALNNLAYAMFRNRRDGALPLAEKANRLLPDVPEFMNTWALLLAESGEAARALELQRRAVKLGAQAPELRLTLAKLLLRTGDHKAARTELESLRVLGPSFAGATEVETLLR